METDKQGPDPQLMISALRQLLDEANFNLAAQAAMAQQEKTRADRLQAVLDAQATQQDA